MTKGGDAKLLGSQAREARTEAKYTQEDLGELLGIRQAAIAKIERGDSSLTSDNLVRLSEILGKSVLYLLGIGTVGLSADEVELLDAYRVLSETGKRYVLEFVHGAGNVKPDEH